MINNITWDEVSDKLRECLGDYYHQAEININNKKEFLYIINNESIALIRPEYLELVIVGFVGVHRLAIDSHVIFNQAKKKGFKSIRIHTKRKGELYFLNKIGLPFYLSEYRKNKNEYVLRAFL